MHRVIGLPIAVLLMFSLSGCYDNKEIDSLATVMAVGIETQGDDKLYTFSVANTDSISSDSKGDSASMISFKEKAKDVKSAVSKVNKKISKSLSFSHLSAIVVSDDCAKKGMTSDMNYFEKFASIRPQTMIAISHIKPSDYLEKLNPVLEVNPEKYFQKVFGENKQYVSYLRLCDFSNAYYTNSTCLAPVIDGEMSKEDFDENGVKVSSSALIWNGRTIAEIKDNWVAGLILSDKTVMYDGTEMKRTKRPKFDFALTKESLKADITLTVETNGKVDTKKAEKDAQSFLSESLKLAKDTLNIDKIIKKNFIFQNKYENYNWDKILTNTSFDVKILVASESL